MITNRNFEMCVLLRVPKFTLIELMTTLAILVLLLSLLLPALKKTQDGARGIQCASQQKQFGLAVSMYVNDYDEWVPADEWGNFRWAHLACPDTLSYLSDSKIMLCPAESKKGYTGWIGLPPLGTNYVYNAACGSAGIIVSGAVRYPPVKMSQIKAPSQFTLLMDGKADPDNDTALNHRHYDMQAWDGPSSASFKPDLYYRDPLTTSSYFPLSARHRGRINTLFSDGHSLSPPYTANCILWSGTVGWQPWNF
jgi:prepilin-type processing-associated H-X9-DG protein